MADVDFENTLRANPGDVVGHLAYSDWLEEHGELDLALWHREAAKCGVIPNVTAHYHQTGVHWPFVYIHGIAEDLNYGERRRPGRLPGENVRDPPHHAQREHGLRRRRGSDEAPDLVYSDVSMPNEVGEYPVLVCGQPAWAVLDWSSHTFRVSKSSPDWLRGRIALVSDEIGLAHARRTQDWR